MAIICKVIPEGETFNFLQNYSWTFELPLMLLLASLFYGFLPEFIENAYTSIIYYTVPLFFIIESFQLVNVTMYFTEIAISKIGENPNLVKGIILVISGISYTICIILFYFIFQEPNLSISNASYYSVTCTLLIVITALTIYVSSGVISDPALLSLLVSIFSWLHIGSQIPPFHNSETKQLELKNIFDVISTFLINFNSSKEFFFKFNFFSFCDIHFIVYICDYLIEF